LLKRRHRASVFLATRGDFVRVAPEERREVLVVGPNDLYLVRPSREAWRLRRQFLTGLSALGVVATVIALNGLRAARADLLVQVATFGLIFAMTYSVGRLGDRAIWRILARNTVGPGLALQLRSAEYRRFGHHLNVVGGDKIFDLAVYGSRRRVKNALESSGDKANPQGQDGLGRDI